MRVLFLLRSTNPKAGGVETATSNLAAEFERHNCEVFVVAYSTHEDCPYKNVLLLNDADVAGNVVLCQEFIEKNSIEVVVNQIYNSAANTELIENLKLCGKVRIITCLHTTPSFFLDTYKGAVRFSSRRDLRQTIKWLLRLCTLPYYWYIRAVRPRKMLYRDYAASDKFVVLSRSYKEMFCKMYSGVDSSRIEVICNPMSSTFYDEPKTGEKQNEMIYVGRLDLAKQIDLTLSIWGKVSKQLPDWSFRVVGDGPILQYLQQYVSTNGIERVEWCGFASDLLPYYDRAKILILTSLLEGLPMTIVESQCRGVVPVLTNSFGAASEMVDGGASGVIVEVEDALCQLPQILIQLAHDSARLDALSMQAVAKAQQYRSAEIWKCWQPLLSQYNEVLF